VRILLADDHPIFAEALEALIQRNILGSNLTVVGDIDAAHRALEGDDRFDLAILDLHMPGAEGFEAIERTLQRFPDTPVVVISGAASPTDVSRALELGVRGFLPKTLSAKILTAALHVITSGGTYVPSEYARSTPKSEPSTHQSLTPREAEVLVLLAKGRANKEIARALDIREITIKLHVHNIFRKLGVRNRVEAVNTARDLGLVG
jgi:DNA-binding NarL/FixJ family response regulator